MNTDSDLEHDTNLNNSDNECDNLDYDNNISKKVLSEADDLNNNMNYFDSSNTCVVNQINDVLDLSDNHEEDLDKDMIILSDDLSIGDENKNEVINNSECEKDDVGTVDPIDPVHHVDPIDVLLPETKLLDQPVVKPENSKLGVSHDNKATSGSKCEVCSENVYPMEKVMLDSKIYHRNCFRCCKCKKSLSPTVVSKAKGNLFCKPHYIELFRMRGKYDDIDVNTFSTEFQSNNEISVSSVNSAYTDKSQESNYANEKRLSITKEKISAKDLAKKFQDEPKTTECEGVRKPPPLIDIGVTRHVSDATQIWVDSNADKQQQNFSNDNNKKPPPQIDIGFRRKVSDVTQSMIEGGQGDLKKCNTNSSYITELDTANQTSKGSVKNLKALFESKN